ncbi:mechanosensitive ion channel family protein [Vineibacter terrae]|uniref:mechanosensitive ion channel family protein n=1 Tax=Vineibacter terrae TaxID=2586908 RepID=UPI002E322763|nr:mechanosensitive ion channel domain-containing protein [Vineibacter terrae]HEX2887587.1 mechanosensitive ion channel domain-containing protein [Vineibacter terrae]
MDHIFELQFYLSEWEAARRWLADNAMLLSISTVGQAIVVLAAFLAARLVAPRIRATLERITQGHRLEIQLRRAASAIAPLTLPVAWLVLLWVAVLIAAQADLPRHLMAIVVSLLTAWMVIRLTASLVRDPVWSRFVTLVVWAITALNILDLLGPTMALLDSVAITLGGLRISALIIVKAMLSLAILLWLATLAGRVLERRITSSPNLTPSLQVLTIKLLKIVLVVIAIVVALRTVGIDLTAFAVFTGAVGVGIGFGLQKAVSNFISGISILIDKSIKPGDVISVGDTYGWVSSLGARHLSVITRDATEYLIPNEELITHQVINWSYSNSEVRLKLPVGIAYGADVRQAIALCQEAAAETPRVLKAPPPACLIKGFGDSSINLELRIWINDPRNGVSNVKSEVFLRIWDRFRAHGIEIPFPQRDLHLKTPPEICVVTRPTIDAPMGLGSRLEPTAP